MSNQVRLCLALHNHQPVGNFDHVFEQSFLDSYQPFLDVFEDYTDLKISLHTSGPLMEWLQTHHPDYVDRVASFVAAGRIEIIGGPFYEPIMTMIPSRDRIGQIQRYTRWLESRLHASVQGMWTPERVWEQSLTKDISNAGIRYTILDDFHFKNAGLTEEQLFGYYVTEDEGKLICVFPGSERLRYLIPFAEPHETIDYLRSVGERHENTILVFGDDGEKFGTWPNTKQHVYDNGWLRRFFDLLSENRDWINTTTLSEAMSRVRPLGKVFIPEGSYREMTEWALPTELQTNYEDLCHDFEHDGRWHELKRFVRGGYWRNFKIKYPESDDMYTRMLSVSERVSRLEAEGLDVNLLDAAKKELYRAQCNCSYWHGAFGGIYLPHLRNAVYTALIAAENLLDQASGMPPTWVEGTAADYNFDSRSEVRLENDRLIALIEPHKNGQLYELDVRPICHNLMATLARRSETYHRKVLAGPSQDGGDVASIHDRVVFKQEGLEQRVQYDNSPRRSLIDHFFASEVSREEIENQSAQELGTFLDEEFEAVIRRKQDRVQVMLTGNGLVEGIPLKLTKGITLEAGSSTLEISYMIEGLPAGPHFPLRGGVQSGWAAATSGGPLLLRGEWFAAWTLGRSPGLRKRARLGLGR